VEEKRHMAMKKLCVYFTYFSKSSRGQIYMKFCVISHLADIINRAKFYVNRVRGFNSVGGRIFGFSEGKRSRR